jgi:NitT/TauT family transport system substrate-binding protein
LKRFLVTLVAAAMVVVALAGCSKPKATEQVTLRIADQYGLGYAEVPIMLEQKLIEKYIPGVTIERVQLGSGNAVREAMVAGQLDIGFMGIPPFLIGWDKGVEWKIMAGLSSMPLLLVTRNPAIKSLKDLKPTDKIALPSIGSNQHIVLQMAADKEYGNPNALDQNVVSLPHPDAAASIKVGKDVAAYYGAPPYTDQLLLDPAVHVIRNSFDDFGEDFSYIVAVSSAKFYNEHPEAYKGFMKALNEAAKFLRDHPKEAAEILAKADGKVSADDYYKYLTAPQTTFNTKVVGVMRYANFMLKIKSLSKVPKSLDEVVWENPR